MFNMPTVAETQDNAREVIVRQYGLGQPEGDLDLAFNVLRKETALWNTLVEIERDNRAAYRAIMSGISEVAEIEVQLESLKAKRVDLIAERKLARKTARKRVATPDLDAAIAELKTPIQALAARAKVARKDGRELVKPRLDLLEQERRGKVKQARNASGLWWPNYNAICADYDTARVKAMRENTELRFHRFDGSGRFTFQVQGGMTTRELFAGEWNQVQVDPVDTGAFTDPRRGARKKLSRTRLRFAIASLSDSRSAFSVLTFPLFLHRPLPEDARIKMVVVKVKRIASKTRWSVTFTCVRELPVANPTRTNLESKVALNLGFRVKADGLRIAVCVDNHGREDEYRLPVQMLDTIRHLDDLQQEIDGGINAILPRFKEALSADVPECLARDAASVRSAKIGGRTLTMIVRRWKEQAVGFKPNALAVIEEWRKAHKTLYERQCHTRDKLVARRKDIYRVWAAQLARDYGAIRIEDTDYRHLLAKEQKDGSESAIQSAVRQLARLAAPGEFRKCVSLAAAKSGAVMETLPGSRLTLRCYLCGFEQNITDGKNDRDAIMWTCGHCGEIWDQDKNFARNLLAAELPSPREGSGDAVQAG